MTLPVAVFHRLCQCYYGGGPRDPNAPNPEAVASEQHISDPQEDEGSHEPIESIPLSKHASRPTLHPRGHAARILDKTDQPLRDLLKKEAAASEAATDEATNA